MPRVGLTSGENIFQARVLEHVAAFAERYSCVSAIFVFGSVARGETETAHDIDLAVEYLPPHDVARHHHESYTRFQAAYEDWAIESRDLLGA